MIPRAVGPPALDAIVQSHQNGDPGTGWPSGDSTERPLGTTPHACGTLQRRGSPACAPGSHHPRPRRRHVPRHDHAGARRGRLVAALAPLELSLDARVQHRRRARREPQLTLRRYPVRHRSHRDPLAQNVCRRQGASPRHPTEGRRCGRPLPAIPSSRGESAGARFPVAIAGRAAPASPRRPPLGDGAVGNTSRSPRGLCRSPRRAARHPTDRSRLSADQRSPGV